jgi:transposase
MARQGEQVDNVLMSEHPVPAGIAADEWQATPRSVQGLVSSLVQRVSELEERLNRNSRNSSLPPSADPPQAPPRPARQRSKRKRGGQPGHRGRTRPFQSAAQVERVVEVRPTSCAHCGMLLLGDDPQPQTRQVSEVPRRLATTTEYRRHRLTCLCCGAQTPAAWPADMPPGSFGPRLQATVGYLTGRLGLSQRDVTEVLETLCHTRLALGSVSNIETALTTALSVPVREAARYVQQQPVSNVDETGWKEETRRRWLWLATTPAVTVFQLCPSRGASGLQQVLGPGFGGIVGSDRWSAYRWLPPPRRQLCWAHLQRDFQQLAERTGAVARLGTALLKQGRQLFRLWQRVRAGTLTRATFQARMQPVCTRVEQLLPQGTTLTHPQSRRVCQNIVRLKEALWTFVREEGVEPTNNAAERPLRRAVLWRRRSFGTQSATGSQFVAHILTVVTTLRQQQRDILDYLTAACAALHAKTQPPSLLPTPLTP